jgi:probable HAF family extracellular repeat protein
MCNLSRSRSTTPARVTGVSFDEHGNPRPFLWQNGAMRDLNELVLGAAPLYLLFGPSINAVGEIAGFGVTEHGDMHAFVANPVAGNSEADRAPVRLPETLRQTLGDGRGRFSLGVRRPR